MRVSARPGSVAQAADPSRPEHRMLIARSLRTDSSQRSKSTYGPDNVRLSMYMVPTKPPTTE
jgi:hypothetical protein